MRLGVNTVPEHKTPEEWAEKLEGIGCRAASFPVDFRAPVSVIDAYVKAAKEHDILIAEVGVWNSPNDTDETKALAAQSVCEEQLRLAEYVQARCCVNVSGAKGPVWYQCYKENFSEELYHKNVEFLQRLCDAVNPKHTFYTLEPMQWMLPYTPAQYARLLRDVNRSGFAVHMDIVNFVRDPFTYTHTSQLVDEAFDTLGTYIKSCHLKDCILEDGTTVSIQEVPPGQGAMDNLHYMERIRELDKDMPVLLEHAADWNAYKQGMAYAKTMVEKLKEGQNEISA